MKTGRIAVAVGILCAALFLGHSFLLAQEKAVGKVVAMEGRASITRQGKNIPAALLAEIYPADTVVTARGSKLKILFIDDSILALGGRSKIIIEKFLYQKKEERSNCKPTCYGQGHLSALIPNFRRKLLARLVSLSKRLIRFVERRIHQVVLGIWPKKVRGKTGAQA